MTKLRNKIKAFWRMPIKDKQWFFICFGLCGVAKLAIQCLSYQRLSVYFGRSCKMSVASSLASKQQHQQALVIRRAVALASRYTPWQSTCLTQALVAKFWCQRFQIPYFFYIGLSKGSKLSNSVDAHAWVTVGPIAVTGGQGLETHHVICGYTNVF